MYVKYELQIDKAQITWGQFVRIMDDIVSSFSTDYDDIMSGEDSLTFYEWSDETEEDNAKNYFEDWIKDYNNKEASVIRTHFITFT